MGIKVVKRQFSLDFGLMTISAVWKDGVKYHLLFDERNTFAFSREQVLAIIAKLQTDSVCTSVGE